MIEILLALIPIDIPVRAPEQVEITICGDPYISAVDFDDSIEGEIAWAMVTLKARHKGQWVPSRPYFRLKDSALPDTDIVSKLRRRGCMVWPPDGELPPLPNPLRD